MTEQEKDDLRQLLTKYIAAIEERRERVLLNTTVELLEDLTTAANDIIYDLQTR